MKSPTFSSPVSLLVLALVAGQLLLKTWALDPLTPDSSSGVSETVNMTLVRETQALIAEGDRNIQLDPRKRNLTLLLGITGSGKSTMAQLISRANNGLEAYKKSKYAATLIRDAGRMKISHSSNTLKSHTLFPELVTDEDTLEAMYDCPGFQDTRSTSVEIAIGFFIKKLVEHAQNIRLLVIVKHDAVKSGGSRSWFTILMTQLLSFSKSFKNYRGGIALLATKMEVAEEDVRPQMANFLGESYEHILEKWPERKDDIDILFGSWLLQDANESYVNLDYFTQPKLQSNESERLLSEMPTVVANRQRIRQMIFNNTHFTHQKCHPEDFGIPLSFEAISNIQKMDALLKDQVARGVANVSHDVQEKFRQVALEGKILPPATFATIMKASERAENATSAQQVSQVLLDLVQPFGLHSVTAMLPELTEKVKVRQYLEKLVPPTQGDGAAAEYVELMKTIVLGVAKSAEERIRSRVNSVVNQVFFEATGNIVRSMQSMTKTRKIEALQTTARVLNGCTLNAYDFAECVRKIGDLRTNPQTARFGLRTETLEIVSKLKSMLRTDTGVWPPDLQKASFLSNLKLNLENFGVSVGEQAGVSELFPNFGRKCVA